MKVYSLTVETPSKNLVHLVVVARDLLGVHRALKSNGLLTTVRSLTLYDRVNAFDKKGVR